MVPDCEENGDGGGFEGTGFLTLNRAVELSYILRFLSMASANARRGVVTRAAVVSVGSTRTRPSAGTPRSAAHLRHKSRGRGGQGE